MARTPIRRCRLGSPLILRDTCTSRPPGLVAKPSGAAGAGITRTRIRRGTSVRRKINGEHYSGCSICDPLRHFAIQAGPDQRERLFIAPFPLLGSASPFWLRYKLFVFSGSYVCGL